MHIFSVKGVSNPQGVIVFDLCPSFIDIDYQKWQLSIYSWTLKHSARRGLVIPNVVGIYSENITGDFHIDSRVTRRSVLLAQVQVQLNDRSQLYVFSREIWFDINHPNNPILMALRDEDTGLSVNLESELHLLFRKK